MPLDAINNPEASWAVSGPEVQLSAAGRRAGLASVYRARGLTDAARDGYSMTMQLAAVQLVPGPSQVIARSNMPLMTQGPSGPNTPGTVNRYVPMPRNLAKWLGIA
jgi:hypothetical protein